MKFFETFMENLKEKYIQKNTKNLKKNRGIRHYDERLIYTCFRALYLAREHRISKFIKTSKS